MQKRKGAETDRWGTQKMDRTEMGLRIQMWEVKEREKGEGGPSRGGKQLRIYDSRICTTDDDFADGLW